MSDVARQQRKLLAWILLAKTVLICAALVFLESFSVYSTSTGLYAFFNGWHWPLIVALAASFHAIAIAWFLSFRETRRYMAIAPYIVFSLVFIGYSWSFHWSHFRGSEVAGQDLSAKVQTLQETAFKARAQLSLIADKTQELAKYSEQRATEEERSGGTCGDRSGPLPRRRHWVRMDDNREAKSIAELAQQQLPSLDRLIEQTRELGSAKNEIVVASRELDAVSNELKAFASDNTAVADIRDRAEQRLRLSQNGYDVPGYGLTRCPDPIRDALLNGVMKAAKISQPNDVHVMTPDSVSEAQKRIWGRAIGTLAAVWSSFWGRVDPAVMAEQLDRYDYTSLITASFVEFAILWCLLWLPRPSRGVGGLAGEIGNLSDEPSSTAIIGALEQLLFGLDPRTAAVLGRIEDHIWWPDPAGDPILVVPVAPREHAEPGLYRIAEILVEAERAWVPRSSETYALNVRWWFSAPPHLRKLAKLATLRLYRIDRHTYRQLMIALALRQGTSNQHGNPGAGQIVITPSSDPSQTPPPNTDPQTLPVPFRPAAE